MWCLLRWFGCAYAFFGSWTRLTGRALVCTMNGEAQFSLTQRRDTVMKTAGEQPQAGASRRKIVVGAILSLVGLRCAYGQKVGKYTSLTAIVDPRGLTTVTFRVDGEPANRVVFSTVRCTGTIASVALTDPSGKEVWRRAAADLGLVARDHTGQSRLGDVLTAMPEIRDAKRGDWRLTFETANSSDPQGQIVLAYTVLPRFELVVQRLTAGAVVGQPLLFAVRPLDYGKPVTGLTNLTVTARNPSGAVVVTTPAVELGKSREGIALTQEPGVYTATLSFEAAGSYRVEASHVFAGDAAAQARSATIEALVGKREGTLDLVAMRPRKGTAGCTGEFVLDFAVEAAVAGDYICSLTLQGGDPKLPRATTSITLAEGKGKLSVVVTHEMLIRLTQPWTRLNRAVLMRMTPGELRVVAERRDIDLQPLGAYGAPLCG